ncbi:MAG: hypothetical protein CMP10_21600 [Zetaproteobacteria bacterium]|nr:hypothetical protein [Pseudobdellovibrionaceae bacterium]
MIFPGLYVERANDHRGFKGAIYDQKIQWIRGDVDDKAIGDMVSCPQSRWVTIYIYCNEFHQKRLISGRGIISDLYD